MSDEQKKAADIKSLENIVNKNPNLAVCKCGYFWEPEEGVIQNDLKDNKG